MRLNDDTKAYLLTLLAFVVGALLAILALSVPAQAAADVAVTADCDAVTITNLGDEPADIGYGAGEATKYATIQPNEIIQLTGGDQYWAVWYVLPDDGYQIIAEGNFYECPPPTTAPGTCYECGNNTTTTIPASTTTTIEPETTTTIIAEDDPAWDCETMGNKICGDTTTTTAPPPVTTTTQARTELPYTGRGDFSLLLIAGSVLIAVGAGILTGKNRGR